MKIPSLILLAFSPLIVTASALAQNVQMQCRALVANDFLAPDDVIVNNQVCHAVRSAAVQAAASPAPVQAAVLAVPVAAAPLASGPAGKPQTTMFKHQTLGESWEDFKRITGMKNPCGLNTPQGAQWCETSKKIEAGENGALTDNNSSASVSLVFSEKKLIQVFVVAKADWIKSLAEFTQTYGVPDTQTANSAVWSFADQGGITANVVPSNLVRANFYSIDGKPKAEETQSPTTRPEPQPLQGLVQGLVKSESVTTVASPPASVQSDYLTVADLQRATQGSGKGVTITAGSSMGQAFAAGLANVNIAEYASIQLFTTESWIAFRAHVARQQFQQFNPNNLPREDTLRGLTVVAIGGAYGSAAGPRCNSVTRIALISDKGGEAVAEAISQETASSSWSNAFGASASCNALVAKFAITDVRRVASAAERGEYFVGVFSGSNLLFMYKVKGKYLKELGH